MATVLAAAQVGQGALGGREGSLTGCCGNFFLTLLAYPLLHLQAQGIDRLETPVPLPDGLRCAAGTSACFGGEDRRCCPSVPWVGRGRSALAR